MVGHTICPACGHCIREYEPDIVLKKCGGSEKHFYHVRCSHEPGQIVATDPK
jgi:hypothetical protein